MSTEASSTASRATPAQIHATGGPDWVRVIVVSLESWRSVRAVSCACRGLGPYSSLVSECSCFFVGTTPVAASSSAVRNETASGKRWNGSFAIARSTIGSIARMRSSSFASCSSSCTSLGVSGVSLTC